MPNAHVISVADLLRFRQALVKFQEEGLGILLGLDQQSQRLLQWLEGEAPTYWRMEVLRCHELISRSRSALETAMMKKSRDYTPSCIEEKEQLQRSKHRLVQAEEKRESVRRWARLAREEVDEYCGRVAPLRELLEQGIPKALARLDNTVQALERYFEAQAPTAPRASAQEVTKPSLSGTPAASLTRPVTPVESPAFEEEADQSLDTTNGTTSHAQKSSSGMQPEPPVEAPALAGPTSANPNPSEMEPNDAPT